MKIILVGAGAVGFRIARQLINDKEDVVVIERDPDIVRYVTDRLDCKVVQGEGNNLNVLKQADIAEADYFITMTGSDEINMACCYLVDTEFSHPTKIIRIRNLDYTSSQVIERSLSGRSYVVNPDREMGNAIMDSIQYGAFGDIINLAGDEIQMRSVQIGDDSPLAGKTLIEVSEMILVPFLIPLARTSRGVIIPSGDYAISRGDTVYIAAASGQIDQLFSELTGFIPKNIKNIIIIGGSRIGVAVAGRLTEKQAAAPGKTWFKKLLNRFVPPRRNVRFIERDYARCKQLGEQLPGVQVLHADISEEDIFEEERLTDADLIIAATENQELNIIAALYAKKVGIKRTVVLVKTRNFINIASQFGLDVVVSSSSTTVNAVLSYIHGESVKRVQSIADGSVDMIEFTINEGCVSIDKAIKDLRLPAGALIPFVYRSGKAVLANGNTRIRQGDHIVVLSAEKDVNRLKPLFSNGDGDNGRDE